MTRRRPNKPRGPKRKQAAQRVRARKRTSPTASRRKTETPMGAPRTLDEALRHERTVGVEHRKKARQLQSEADARNEARRQARLEELRRTGRI